MRDQTPHDRRVLTFAPLWVLSAVAGHYNRFHPLLEQAFWEIVDDLAVRTSGLTGDVLDELRANHREIMIAFDREGLPIVSGLGRVLTVLEREDESTSVTFRNMLLEMGEAVARARGPFGRSITRQDDETLQILTGLLELESSDGDAFEVSTLV